MVANQPRTSSRLPTTKLKSSSRPSTSSSSSHKASTPSLVQSSAKKAVKVSASSKGKKKPSKFRDMEQRELLDGQTSQLLAQSGMSGEQGQETATQNQDTFSYGPSSSADQRRTRRGVEEAARALDLLMKS